jgi:chromosome partitioning protein
VPSLGILTVNAMTAADSVLIPLQLQFYAADGLMFQLYALSELKIVMFGCVFFVMLP